MNTWSMSKLNLKHCCRQKWQNRSCLNSGSLWGNTGFFSKENNAEKKQKATSEEKKHRRNWFHEQAICTRLHYMSRAVKIKTCRHHSITGLPGVKANTMAHKYIVNYSTFNSFMKVKYIQNKNHSLKSTIKTFLNKI